MDRVLDKLEGLARSIAHTAMIGVDPGYRDRGMYAFSQLLGFGAALLVMLTAITLGLQVIAEERELRLLIASSGATPGRRWRIGIAAFLPPATAISVASIAGLAFTWDIGLPEEVPEFGYAPIGFLVASLLTTVGLAFIHRRRPASKP